MQKQHALAKWMCTDTQPTFVWKCACMSVVCCVCLRLNVFSLCFLEMLIEVFIFLLKKWPMIYKYCFNYSSKKTCNIQNVSDDEKCASLILVSVSNQKSLVINLKRMLDICWLKCHVKCNFLCITIITF